MSSRSYDLERFDFMAPQGPHMPVTEPYVSVPPALIIRDNEGAIWTIGFSRAAQWRTGEYEYDVVRNGKPTGEWACRIEFRKNKVRIFGEAGWRTWNGRSFI